MERLARPLSELAAHYQVIVVGSGYGGSIAACRLSRVGRTVALFERGRELHPGEFPATALEAARHVQLSGPPHGDGRVGDPRNLYWFRTGAQMSVFSGCGLGGTSLVNANVAIRPDPRVFDGRWPAELRHDGHGGLAGPLVRGYAAAEAMLRPATYPTTYPPLAKVAALKVAAAGRPVEPTPINVTFREGLNAAGVHQPACTGCGDCVTGCNVGAKNTLLMNYLPDAVTHRAQVFTELDVRTVTAGPGGQGWVVHVQPLGLGPDKSFDPPALAITAEVVVLAAGALGSTEILLRSKEAGLAVSEQIGMRFSGNGDVIGFAERPRIPVRAIGAGRRPPDPATPAGPCITAMIDLRSAAPVDDGIIIEDAVVPGLMAEVVAGDLALQIGVKEGRGDHRIREGLAGAASLLTGGQRGGNEHLQTFLVMGHDDEGGRVVLDGDEARIEWDGVGTTPYYERANQVLADAARQDGGTFIHDPLWSPVLKDSLITVHPLGGCAMGKNALSGVVDHRGRVFSLEGKKGVHNGLMVVDGSIIPAPLGVNPLLTISALAERSMSLLCDEEGWEPVMPPAPPTPPVPPAPPTSAGPPPVQTRPGLRFTERMSGWWFPDPTPDRGSLSPYLDDCDKGRASGDGELSFVLTISTDDVARVTSALDTPMDVIGTVSAPHLSPDPLLVQRGSFQLLVADDTSDAAVRHMRYRLPLAATDGHRYHFDGFKVVAPGEIGEVWPATTTLYVTIRDGAADGTVVGRGVLRIAPTDFAHQLRTMHVTGPAGHFDRLTFEARFGRAFAGVLAHDYGTVVHRTSSFNPHAPPRRRRRLDLPPPRHYDYRTDDGLTLRLTRYRGGRSSPVLLAHGMGNPYTWSLDTVDQTLLEALVHRGYDVWVQEWRSSTLLECSRDQFTGDQVARMDHPAAAAVVAAESGRSDLHVISHCVGSLTWMMATLAGTVQPTSMVCSSVAMHPVAPTITRLKVGLHLGEVLHRLGVQHLTTDSTTNESFWERQFDRELRLYPIPKAEECDQAVCRRVSFIYGNGVHHANLNPATHAALHELFGVTNMTMMDHLSLMARRGKLASATGQDRYLVHLERLRRPVTFIHGALNQVWVPASTERSYRLLVGQFGPADYERVVFDDYGHQDVLNGARAAADTYPAFLAHLARVNA